MQNIQLMAYWTKTNALKFSLAWRTHIIANHMLSLHRTFRKVLLTRHLKCSNVMGQSNCVLPILGVSLGEIRSSFVLILPNQIVKTFSRSLESLSNSYKWKWLTAVWEHYCYSKSVRLITKIEHGPRCLHSWTQVTFGFTFCLSLQTARSRQERGVCWGVRNFSQASQEATSLNCSGLT